MSEPLISNFSSRMAFPIVTDIGLADTRWLIWADKWVIRCLESVVFGGVM